MITFSIQSSAPDVGKKKAEPKTPHFLSFNQDIVACSQEGKWGLKYVIHSFGKMGRKKSGAEAPHSSLKNHNLRGLCLISRLQDKNLEQALSSPIGQYQKPNLIWILLLLGVR